MLEMLNDNDKGIFTVMTSNNVEDLPPELTRAGRLDGIFYFNLPAIEERKEIFKIHMNKKNIKVSDKVINEIAENTEGYTGAEIELIVKLSMRKAFMRCKKENKNFDVTIEDLLAAKEDVIPVSESSKEKIEQLETWVKGRAIYANGKPAKTQKKKISNDAIKSASKLLSK